MTPFSSGIKRYKLYPSGVAVDEDSNICVTDRESHRWSKPVALCLVGGATCGVCACVGDGNDHR